MEKRYPNNMAKNFRTNKERWNKAKKILDKNGWTIGKFINMKLDELIENGK